MCEFLYFVGTMADLSLVIVGFQCFRWGLANMCPFGGVFRSYVGIYSDSYRRVIRSHQA